MQDCEILWNHDPTSSAEPMTFWNLDKGCNMIWNSENEFIGGKNMAQNHFLAGVGRAILLKGDNLIGVAKTLQDSSLNFSIASEEVRGGQANALWGKYFHDSNLGVTLTDAMFSLEYMAASLGVDLESGGLSVKEEQLTVVSSGQVTVTETPVAFDGTKIGWYKKPTESEWKIGEFAEKVMTVSGAQESEVYCVKYFYHNENAKSITIKSQYVPAELHVVILNDLFAGDGGQQTSLTRYGRLIVDIPRLLLEGNQDLSLSASGAATVSLSGNALAVNSFDSCEEDPYYGTMTQEIYGTSWKDDVMAIAVEDGDVALKTQGKETLAVRVLFNGNMAPARKPNKEFTFTVVDTPASTASGLGVGANTGIITAGSGSGSGVISVGLTGHPEVPLTYVKVTVS